jgi:hypothetical protein
MEYCMPSRKLAPLILAVASATAFMAVPVRAAVVFEFESAAIDAFRNWTPHEHNPSHDEQGNQGNQGTQGNQASQAAADFQSPPPDASLLELTTSPELPPNNEQLAATVPEPGTWTLLALGMAGLAFTRRRSARR